MSLAPGFDFLPISPAQAKGGADSATAGEGEPAEGSAPAKCSPSDKNAGSTASAAHAHRFRGAYGGEGPLGHMPLDFSTLSLSDEQKNKIKTIRGRNAARAKELRQALGAKGTEFRDLIFSESATNDQITAKRDEMKPLKDELDNLRLSDFLAIRGVLTSEQRKKWAESKPPEHKPHVRSDSSDSDAPDKADKNAAPPNTTTVKVK